MLAKAACLVTALVSYSLCITPPSSSTSVDPKREQTFVHETTIMTNYAHRIHIIVTCIISFQTALYLVIMAGISGDKGSEDMILKGTNSLPLHDQVVFQMAELETWQVIATVLCLLGYALRKWSFVTLDHLFTVRISPLLPL
jgi:hypothetical protein